jgi:hypothetical protein
MEVVVAYLEEQASSRGKEFAREEKAIANILRSSQVA